MKIFTNLYILQFYYSLRSIGTTPCLMINNAGKNNAVYQLNLVGVHKKKISLHSISTFSPYIHSTLLVILCNVISSEI